MKIGILQSGDAPEQILAAEGTYADMFKDMLGGKGFEFEVWRVIDMEFPASPSEADGWLITGSRHGAYEDHPWIAPLEALIREIDAARVPLVGICFGHQIIAQALGGRVIKHPGGWAIGLRRYHLGASEIALHAWHQDQVVDLPPRATVLAQNDTTQNAILAIGAHILTVQPHPEFGTSVVEGLIAHRASAVEPHLVAAAADSLGPKNDNDLLADWIADVLRGRPATELPSGVADKKASA